MTEIKHTNDFEIPELFKYTPTMKIFQADANEEAEMMIRAIMQVRTQNHR